MAAMLPIYMKHFYKNEALFSDTKIVTSVYSQSFEGTLDVEMINKIKLDGIPEDVVPYIATPDYESIMKSIILMLLLLPLKVFLQV
jgi:starch synthase